VAETTRASSNALQLGANPGDRSQQNHNQFLRHPQVRKEGKWARLKIENIFKGATANVTVTTVGTWILRAKQSSLATGSQLVRQRSCAGDK
jgi:hypothetical protein